MRGDGGGGRAGLLTRQEQASPNLCGKVREQERGVRIAERRVNQLCAYEKRLRFCGSGDPTEWRLRAACLGSWAGAKILENAEATSESPAGA